MSQGCYEFEIVAADHTQHLSFGASYEDWAQIYNAAGAVINDEPQQLTRDGVTMGRIEVSRPYARIVDIMQEELSSALAARLREGWNPRPQRVSLGRAKQAAPQHPRLTDRQLAREWTWHTLPAALANAARVYKFKAQLAGRRPSWASSSGCSGST